MWQKITDFIKLIEPLILVIIPLLFGIWIKLKTKIIAEKDKITKEISGKAKQQLSDWRHKESIKVIKELKEVCNYHRDLAGSVHTSYIQLENGTIATSKICNMFFSCIAEDTRYSKIPKATDYIQRIPFTRMSSWFNKVYDSEYQVVYLTKQEDIDDIFYNTVGIKCMVSSLVRDAKGYVIGICNFMFADGQEIDDLIDCNTQMLKFVSSVETIFLDFNFELENKKKELGLEDVGD